MSVAGRLTTTRSVPAFGHQCQAATSDDVRCHPTRKNLSVPKVRGSFLLWLSLALNAAHRMMTSRRIVLSVMHRCLIPAGMSLSRPRRRPLAGRPLTDGSTLAPGRKSVAGSAAILLVGSGLPKSFLAYTPQEL